LGHEPVIVLLGILAMIALVSYNLLFKEEKHDLANDFLVFCWTWSRLSFWNDNNQKCQCTLTLLKINISRGSPRSWPQLVGPFGGGGCLVFLFWGGALTILFYFASCINIYYNLVIPNEEYWLRKYSQEYVGVFFINRVNLAKFLLIFTNLTKVTLKNVFVIQSHL